MKKTEILLSKSAEKEIRKIPKYIVVKPRSWIDLVVDVGLAESMKSKGGHDEPLKRKRKGQRPIRLSQAYRAIYTINESTNELEIVEIIEVNKHDY